MARRRYLTTMLIAPLALAACNGGDGDADRSAPAADTVRPADPARPATDIFSRYLDHYPFDKVGDHSWLDDPAVARAVKAAVTDETVRKWVMEDGGPATPIAMVGDRVASWSCEAHNCGPHQWVTLVDPKSGVAEICYFDESVAADETRWFSGGREEKRPGKCPEVES